jgi:hypothetical protein
MLDQDGRVDCWNDGHTIGRTTLYELLVEAIHSSQCVGRATSSPTLAISTDCTKIAAPSSGITFPQRAERTIRATSIGMRFQFRE